jgi:rod shape-determining protein MreD
VIAYTALNDPEMPVLLAGFLAGLASDVLLSTPLGEHALALVGLAYLIVRLRSSLVLLPLWQATLVLAPVWALYAFALFWLDGLTRHPADPLLRWLPVATTTAVWPLLVALFASRRFHDRRRPSIR